MGTYLIKCVRNYLIINLLGTIFITIVCSSSTTTQYPDPTSNFYIEDYSGVYTEETERYIMDQAVALQLATKAQIVVVSVPDTKEDSLETFSTTLANKWGIGDEKLDNGILLLFTTGEEPHVRMEVGTGLQGCIPDGKAGRILDEYAVSDKDSGKWNRAAVNTFVATAKLVYQEYGVEVPKDLKEVDKVSDKVKGVTFADATFPDSINEKNTDSLMDQIQMALFMSMIFSTVPYLFYCIVCFFVGTGSGSDSDNDYLSNAGDSSSGDYDGGGGDFDGGGASR